MEQTRRDPFVYCSTRTGSLFRKRLSRCTGTSEPERKRDPKRGGRRGSLARTGRMRRARPNGRAPLDTEADKGPFLTGAAHPSGAQEIEREPRGSIKANTCPIVRTENSARFINSWANHSQTNDNADMVFSVACVCQSLLHSLLDNGGGDEEEMARLSSVVHCGQRGRGLLATS